MLGEDGRLADQDAGDEGAEHGVDADELVSRASIGHHQDGVMTGISLTKLSLVQRMTPDDGRPMVKQTRGRAPCRKGSGASAVNWTAPCAARPPMTEMMTQPMVSSMIEEARMTWPTSRRRKSDLAHHHRDDLDRGDRQRGGEEQSGHQPLARSGRRYPAAVRRARNRT